MKKHRLTLLDRLRGWHWRAKWTAVLDGEVVGVTLVRERNYCGCEVS